MKSFLKEVEEQFDLQLFRSPPILYPAVPFIIIGKRKEGVFSLLLKLLKSTIIEKSTRLDKLDNFYCFRNSQIKSK